MSGWTILLIIAGALLAGLGRVVTGTIMGRLRLQSWARQTGHQLLYYEFDIRSRALHRWGYGVRFFVHAIDPQKRHCWGHVRVGNHIAGIWFGEIKAEWQQVIGQRDLL